MNRTTKINILAYASEPDKNYKYEGDIVDYKGKRYFVSLAEERVGHHNRFQRKDTYQNGNLLVLGLCW